MLDKFVSVIIPVYNGESYVAEAIASVLSQTHQHHEIIVIDDGSTDDSARVVAEYQSVRFVRQENAGAAAARNLGVSLANGDLLAFLDADDVWLPDKLTRQLRAFNEQPSLDLVFGHAEQVVDEKGAAAHTPNSVSHRILPAHLPSAMLIRRAAFDRVGGFHSKWKLGEVVDWFSRAVDANLNMLMLDEVVYRRRIHNDNLGIRERSHQRQYLDIVKTVLERRRASGHEP